MDIWIKKLANGFTVLEREGKGKKSQTVKDERIDAVNKQYRLGAIDETEARKMLKEVIASRKPKKRRLFYPENLKLLDDYWEEVYAGKVIDDPDSARNRLIRGLNAIGPLSLHVASKAELQTAIKDQPSQRDIASVLNQFLKYLGRPFRLSKNKKVRKKIAYLSWKDFNKAVNFVEGPTYRTLFRVLFVTGCRVGEAFHITEILNEEAGVIFVATQMDDKLNPKATKTRVERRVPIICDGLEYVKEWIKVPLHEREKFRNKRLAEILAQACKDAKLTPLTARDVRHCYAVELIQLGASIPLVAQAMGNSVTVCQEYYSGFTLTDPGLEHLIKVIKAAKS